MTKRVVAREFGRARDKHRPAEVDGMRYAGRVATGLITIVSACSALGGTEDASAGVIGNEPELGPPPPCVLANGTDVTGDVHDDIGDATARARGEGCSRELTIDSTAARRDDLPSGPRTLVERNGGPSLQTHNTMFDALYQLARAEADECAVDQIRDWAFHGGEPVSCGVGGCFETGRKWNYVWTRDTSYAVDLGLGWVDPTRAKNSLEFKLSPRRDGSSLFLVQDTGTGGSYPVSSDRAVWAIGARRALLHLAGAERDGFRDKAARAIWATIDHDRDLVFDAADGLYRGEQSFLDWRTQTYPEWTVPDTVHIATSKALSTNVAHLALLETGAELAREAADGDQAARLTKMANDLRARIRDRFWLPDEGQFSTVVGATLDPAPTRRFDLLGTSLAILADVATPEQAREALSRYAVLPKGPPVVFPEQQDVAIYHNRAIWPFVTSYFAKAAKKVGHAAAVDHSVHSLLRGAALNLSNMENLEVVTGRAWLDDGAASGPVVNSQRQLWSVAGYIGTIHEVLFGLDARPDGVKVAPFVTSGLRHELFAKTNSLVLNNARLRGKEITVVVNLPPDTARGDGSQVLPIARVRINGRSVRDGAVIPESVLRARNLVEVDLAPASSRPSELRRLDDVSDYRTLYAPRTPRVTGVTLDGGKLRVGLDLAGESNVTASVYRDGVRVAEGLGEATSSWRDEATDGARTPSHCYTVETRFARSGNASYRAKPTCFWGGGNERIASIDASSFVAEGGTSTFEYGRTFHRGWGAPGDTITATFTADRDGPHLLEATYGNGGPIDTGITCAVKRVDVEEVGGGSAGGGWFVMPQRGSWASWGSSSFVHATLVAGRTYRVRIHHDARSANMSELAHFGVYTAGMGGASGAFSDVNIAELKVLSLRP